MSSLLNLLIKNLICDVCPFTTIFPWMVIRSMGNRILEIEWAVKNNKEYIPSPKPKKKNKKSKSRNTEDNMIIDKSSEGSSYRDYQWTRNAEFGMEVTNTESPSRNKRSLTDIEEVVKQTPMKRRKRSALETPIC